MKMHYYETLDARGVWSPNADASLSAPYVSGGVTYAGLYGPRLRGWKPIAVEHHGLTLTELQALYGTGDADVLTVAMIRAKLELKRQLEEDLDYLDTDGALIIIEGKLNLRKLIAAAIGARNDD